MRKSNTPVPPRIPAARAAAPAFMGQQGGNQHNWKSEKEENPQVFWVSGRAGPEECYFWTWITISWLVWVSVGGGARLIKADDLAQASSCGIKDHDKQLLRQSREPSKGTHGCSCRRSGARSPQDTALGHECRIPGTPGTFPISLCTDEQRWTQRFSPHRGARGVLSAVTLLTVSHKWHFWNLHLLLPLSKTLMQLLQKVTPGIQEKH